MEQIQVIHGRLVSDKPRRPLERLVRILSFLILLSSYSYAMITISYSEGYKDGLKDAPTPPGLNLKEILTTNKPLLTKMCYAWWFKITPKERKM